MYTWPFHLSMFIIAILKTFIPMQVFHPSIKFLYYINKKLTHK